jgi:hypothetical protein
LAAGLGLAGLATLAPGYWPNYCRQPVAFKCFLAKSFINSSQKSYIFKTKGGKIKFFMRFSIAIIRPKFNNKISTMVSTRVAKYL